MSKTIAFSGSNSSKSINHQLVKYAVSQVHNSELIKLTAYDIPMYSIDIEEATGIPEGVLRLKEKLNEADKLIISVAEHNGNPPAFFKNILDWLSRSDRDFLAGKKVILLSTSPGKRGGESALQNLKSMLPRFGANIIGALSIGSFYDNFKEGKWLDVSVNETLNAVLNKS